MTAFAPIPEILDDLRAGKMIVLVDDERRENEGDLVCAAERITPQVVNFMTKHTPGYLCLSLTGEDCDRLELHPQAAQNTSMRSTAMAVSIDAHPRHGVTTGIAASDRAKTIRVAVDPASGPGDLVRPGHMVPLRARDGGVLVRTGQTEGSVDLMRLAGLRPAAVISEISKEDGEMARLPELEVFCEEHDLKICSVADIIEYRLQREALVTRLEPVEGAPIQTAEGEFTLFAYRSLVDPLPHIVLTVGGVGAPAADGRGDPIAEPVLVRMHSRDVLGDIFDVAPSPGELSSGEVLRRSMRLIQETGRGAVVYLRPSVMGGEENGTLAQNLHRLRIQAEELVGADRDRPDLLTPTGEGEKAVPAEQRDIGVGGQILRDLGLRKLRVITNRPKPVQALSGFGIEIAEHVPVPG
jgi:3,4-dihydroxy 2-butanone 4-phosphate synthase/GTP cyclohydrolase II